MSEPRGPWELRIFESQKYRIIFDNNDDEKDVAGVHIRITAVFKQFKKHKVSL